MAMRTITLKIHKPSKRKREIMDDALLRYSKAYQYLLDAAFEQIDNIKKDFKEPYGKYSSFKLSRWVDSNLSKELNRFGIQPFKDSLKIDFGRTIAGYLNLKRIRKNTNFPLIYLSNDEYIMQYNKLLDDITEIKIMEDDIKNQSIKIKSCNKLISKLNRKASLLNPLFFCRYSVNRDYCLLYDEVNKKYYAKLYLMNCSDNRRETLKPSKNLLLRYIHKNGGILEQSNRKERYIIVPLSFGKWQEQYLNAALTNPSIIKTARLIKNKNEFYLAINIEVGEDRSIEPSSYLGLSRDLKTCVFYSVIDKDENVLSKGRLGNINSNDSNSNSNNIMSMDTLHSLANKVVSLSVENKSQVIVESLINKSDRLAWKEQNNNICKPVLGAKNYNDLIKILDYKLTSKGLPPSIKVSPVGIFYKCPICDLHSKRNRFSKDIFICTSCGNVMDIGELGSFNLARKPNLYKKNIIKVILEKTDIGIKFTNKELELDFEVAENNISWYNDLKQEIKKIADNFMSNLFEVKNSNDNFKFKYSIMKRVYSEDDISEMIEIIPNVNDE